MAQLKDMQTGASGDTFTLTTVNSTTVDTTNLEATNLKAKDGTAAGSIANTTGVVTLASSVLTTADINGGTVDGTTIGASSASTGAFTTLASNGATTFTAGTASTSTTTGTAVITGGLGVSGRINAANFDGIVGANTAAAVSSTNLAYTGTLTGGTGVVNLGSGQFYKDASGNVGIGTATPSYKLHVTGGSVFTSLTNSYYCYTSDFGMGTPDSDGLQIFAGATNSIRFGNRISGTYSEHARINSSGNVGIGTATPTSKVYVTTASSTLYGLISQTPVVGLTAGDYVNMAYFSDSRGGSNDGLRIVNVRDSTGSGVGNWETSSYRIRRSIDQNNAATGVQEEIVFGNSLLAFNTDGSERMRIDSSGNVGIGTSSPSGKLHVNGGSFDAFTISGNSTNSVAARFQNSAASSRNYNIGSSGGGPSPAGSFFIYDDTASATRMTIDSSGNLLVGTTTLPTNGGTLHCGGTITSATGYRVKPGQSGALGGNLFNIDWTGSPQLWIDSTNLGTITVVSDYRIKKNVATQTTSALDRVMQLRPVNYEIADYGTLFKADGVVREGFIAHELAEIIPSAVSGEKDTENQIQSLKLDALCSVLTKAIQEQQALIQNLTTRLTALEAI
jgi:hypothetical protein